MKIDNVVVPLRKIHETAVIYPGARLGRDVEVGPYSVIGENVFIGDGTTIGRECMIYHGACLGGPPQDLKFKDEKSFLYIGDNTAIREYAVIHRATGEGEETRVGSHCMIMGATHIAHNCQVGNYVIMSNSAGLAGHVIVEDRAIISGMSGVHQFVKIGRNAMIGGASKVVQDVPPFVIADGRPARVCGLNSVGIARAGINEEARRDLKKAYRLLFRSGMKLSEAIVAMEQELDSSEPVEHLLRFLRNVNRGICRSRREEEATEL